MILLSTTGDGQE